MTFSTCSIFSFSFNLTFLIQISLVVDDLSIVDVDHNIGVDLL